jgi:hypothetical protein
VHAHFFGNLTHPGRPGSREYLKNRDGAIDRLNAAAGLRILVVDIKVSCRHTSMLSDMGKMQAANRVSRPYRLAVRAWDLFPSEGIKRGFRRVGR